MTNRFDTSNVPLLDLLMSTMSPANKLAVKSYARATEYLAQLKIPIRPWEVRLFGSDESVLFARTSMLISAFSEDRPLEEIHSLIIRWINGQFDAVTASAVSIGGFFVEYNNPLERKGLASEFPQSPCQFDEQDVASQHANDGRQDILSSDLPSFTWDCDVNKPRSVLALRTKLPGARFVKVKGATGSKMMGLFEFDVPDDFPVELCEFWAGKFYVLFPYSCSPFVYKNYSFVPHLWQVPISYTMEPWAEGVMILTPSGEYRARMFPSVEIQDFENHRGVWEWGIASVGGEITYFAIRPRPGKVPFSQDRALTKIGSCVSAVSFLALRYGSWAVSMVYEGGLGPIFKRVANVLYIDSGLRGHDPYPRYHESASPPVVDLSSPVGVGRGMTHGVVRASTTLSASTTTTKAVPPQPRPRGRVAGAKIMLITDRNRYVAVQESAQKLFCFPGGSSQGNEDPIETVIREAREELGISLRNDQIYYLGPNCESDSENDYECHLFVGYTPFHVGSKHGISNIVTHDWTSFVSSATASYSPVFKRLLRFYCQRFPTHVDFLGFLCEMCPSVPLGKHEVVADTSKILAALQVRAISSSDIPVDLQGIPQIRPKLFVMAAQGYLKRNGDVFSAAPGSHVTSAVSPSCPSPYISPVVAPPVPPQVEMGVSQSLFSGSNPFTVSALSLAATSLGNFVRGQDLSGAPVLNPLQTAVLEFVGRNPGCTTQTLKKACGVAAGDEGYKLVTAGRLRVDTVQGNNRAWYVIGQ